MKTESNQYPKIKKQGNILKVPVMIEEKTRTIEGTEETYYSYYLIRTENRGLNELDLLKELTLEKLNDIYEYYASQIVKQYPNREVETFRKQVEEAKKYIADNTASVPFIENLAIERGLTVAEMADKILAKDAQFSELSGQLTGKRQRLEKEVKNATIDTVQSIAW